MRILVFPEEGRSTIAEPDDLKKFHVEVHGEGGEDDLSRALGQLGRTEGAEHAWIFIEELLRASGRADDETWRAAFGQMVDYAASKGWTDADGESLRAHIVAVP
ncbi:hypothetical protein IA539_21950 [Gordonia sp. zg691]|uniref:Uncharacterized protein n=1 Tax=Gordonia jinghuaiqii TaxID=2758710 RepID=A0A7D7LU57_9ACTN|nr:hypothetical protein [Gordonia jinghuaiqii]MBD0863837.1 hypothetical protein [Gordonia jinghuaiqii]MCR5979941.1 hypothetical protein [Gordonia jinghuaiqii]QMT03140.1 hypothetical protein H1R19_08530 [Gordonia jinghuaiqii]